MSQTRDPLGVALGRLIRNRRKAMGLSQSALAEKLSLSYQQIQRYENGTSEITVTRLTQIAAHCYVPIEHFLRRLPDPHPTGAVLSDDEQGLLQAYRRIRDSDARVALRQLARLLGSVRPTQPTKKRRAAHK